MAKKVTTVLGIEYDQFSLRAARVSHKKVGDNTGFFLDQLEERQGDFSKDAELAKALQEIKESAYESGCGIVSCVSGKQIFVGEIPFRTLADQEMKDALRLELRKSIPFDLSNSAIEYQVVGPRNPKEERRRVLVTAVANVLLEKHLQALDNAGLKPGIVDALPTAIANAHWAMQGASKADNDVAVLAHMGPVICTLVVAGKECPFFQRGIHFPSNEILAKEKAPAERERLLDALGDEILRSLSYYQQTYSVQGFPGMQLLGENADVPELAAMIERKVRLQATPMDLEKKSGVEKPVSAGKYALAISLAMRTDFVL